MMKVSSSSSSLQRPLILSNPPPPPRLSPKIFAYYSVLWEQKQNDMHLEMNSCLYFQNPSDDDDEWEQVREDGCGYVVIYPAPHRPLDENLQIYNFDRMKNDSIDNKSKRSLKITLK